MIDELREAAPEQADQLLEDDGQRQFSLKNLCQIDHGRVASEFDFSVSQVWQHITRYPYQKDGDKIVVQTRKLHLDVEFTPEIKIQERMTESGNAAFASLTPRVHGVLTNISVNSKLPHFKTSNIRLRTKLDKNRIVLARFHPDDNDNEFQRQLPYGEDQ